MQVQFRNLTLREIVILDKNDQPTHRLPAEGDCNNYSDSICGDVVTRNINGIDVVDTVLGKVSLPDPEKDTFLIVDRIVAEAAAAQGRVTTDLLMPSEPRRGPSHKGINQGEIIGWRQLAQIPRCIS